MFPFHRILLAAVFSLLAPLASGAGLVQLSLDGEITTQGGAMVDVTIHFLQEDEELSLETRLHLAQRTSAHDLASLLVTRLEAAGVGVLHTTKESAGEGPAQIFVEDTRGIDMRLGHGLRGGVTLCNSSIRSLRITPPEVAERDARLDITASLYEGHTKSWDRRRIELVLKKDGSSALYSQELFKAAMAVDLITERPSPDRWRIEKGADGSTVQGCTVELDAQTAAWRIELWL